MTFELRVQESDRLKAGDVVAIAHTGTTEQELEAWDAGTVAEIIKTDRGYILIIAEGTQG